MTDVKAAVERIAEKMSRGGPASWVDVAFLLDHLEAVERELGLTQRTGERLVFERDALRERLESAELELTQWRRGVPSFAHSTRTNRQATEQWERWHARLLERFGGRGDV